MSIDQLDDVMIHATADVDATATVGRGSRIWHLAQLCGGAHLGVRCVVGRGAYIGPDVSVGDHTKIQNYALVYAPARLGDGVSVGPGVVLTNDLHPRAVDPSGAPKDSSSWTPVGVSVLTGASLGARSVCVAPVTVGRWAMVGAGAVVVDDVPDFALVVGVPARRIGWVGPDGHRLRPDGATTWVCERTGERYVEQDGVLRDHHT